MDMNQFRKHLAKKQNLTEANDLAAITSIISKIQKQEEKLEKEIAGLYDDGIKEILKVAKGLVGKNVSIEEPISATMHGDLVYKITAINDAYLDRSIVGAHDMYGAIVLEYSAALISKPKNYRGAYDRTPGKVYKKRITLDRLRSGVMKIVK